MPKAYKIRIEFNALNAINVLHEICTSCHNTCNTCENIVIITYSTSTSYINLSSYSLFYSLIKLYKHIYKLLCHFMSYLYALFVNFS